MMNICQLTATEIIAHLKERDFSAVDVTQACLDNINRFDSDIHAWVYVEPEIALQQAQNIDDKLVSDTAGALAGIPIGIKDIFNTTEFPTQMGSPLWQGFTPGNDARVVHYLRMADAILLGKTVTAEFAVHTPGPTCNPHNSHYSPGTSSSGSAAAVAAQMVPLAIGTQTAGSIIRPASYCGVYGYKPSFGLVPRTGMLKTTDSLDTVGMFARSVDDLEILFDIIRVHGTDYPISHERLNNSVLQHKRQKVWRVGLLQGPKWGDAEPYAQKSLLDFTYKLSGIPDVKIEHITLPNAFDHSHDIHETIYDKALAYYFKDEFKSKSLVSAEMYDIIKRGNEISLEQYKGALDSQNVLTQQLDSLFAEKFDIILDLSTGGEALEGLDSTDRLDNCLIWSLCGVPSMNLPVFSGPNNLPFGAQIFTRRYSDYLLLNFARHIFEQGLIERAPFPEID